MKAMDEEPEVLPIAEERSLTLSMRDFIIGDVVVLKSGGPKMTVASDWRGEKSAGRKFQIRWFAGDKLEWGVFHEAEVELAVEPVPPPLDFPKAES
jgi:uncharacterized protein YodC (DUF2158 family)